MPKCERIGELVDLCEEAQSLATALNLDFIAFLANMVVLEARQAHYFSDDAAKDGAPAEGARTASRHRRRAVERPSRQPASNVTHLAGYRNARHLTLVVQADQKSRGPDS